MNQTASQLIKKTLTGHFNSVLALVVLKNGDLASGSFDGMINIWNTQTYELKTKLAAHSNWVCALLVLKNGYLVSGSGDKTILIYILFLLQIQ